MDLDLKLLAEASLAVTAAEEAVEANAFHTARDELDAAGAVLDELRSGWPDMNTPTRLVVGPAAAHVRVRLDAAAARIPRLSAVSEGAPVIDPEQELEPAA